MRWQEFQAECPQLASVARERFARDQLGLLGTIRRDGSPRVSPCEIDFAGPDLLLGMMWRSRKALDLLRDPRITVHSVPVDKDNKDGDVKLTGLAVEVLDPDERKRFEDAIEARIQWHPTGDYHLFALDVRHAAMITFGEPDGMWVSRWRPGEPLRREQRPE
ncbi:MAG: pyridoxamine 5'-phosphate oxidase family protein [Actinocatenispora sp.]